MHRDHEGSVFYSSSPRFLSSKFNDSNITNYTGSSVTGEYKVFSHITLFFFFFAFLYLLTVFLFTLQMLIERQKTLYLKQIEK